MSTLTNHQRLLPGTTQAKGLSALIGALAPDSFQMDDRSWQDFITTTHRFAAWLTYYDATNQADGDWKGFWEQEQLTFLAVLAAEDVEGLRQAYEDAEKKLVDALLRYANPADDSCTENPEPEMILGLIEMIRLAALKIGQYYTTLTDLQHPLAAELQRLIERKNDCDPEELEGALQRLIAYHKRANLSSDELDYHLYASFFEKDQPKPAKWGVQDRDAYDAIPSVQALPKKEALRELFKVFLDTLTLVKRRAQVAFEVELVRIQLPENEEFRIVQPHIALFVTFLQLFRYLQEDLNQLPNRHLDYYYEKVLCLERKPAHSDSAYLIFTLAKEFNEKVIVPGTLFLGGKDKNGRPLYYEATALSKITQAQVAEIKSVYYAKLDATATNPATEVLKVAPVSNSANGKGEPFKKGDEPCWRIFADDDSLSEGEVGFILASTQLLLQEGQRVIKIELPVTQPTDFPQELNIQLTTKEGWSKEKILPAALIWGTDYTTDKAVWKAKNKPEYSINVVGSKVEILILLPKTFPAIVADQSGAFRYPIPAIKLSLNPSSTNASAARTTVNWGIAPVVPYQSLWSQVTDRTVPIAITVRAYGIQKSLILQNDTGQFNGEEKFLPFGPLAEKGARFYLGFDEAFQKAFSQLDLDFDWVDYAKDSNLLTYYAKYDVNTDSDVAIEVVNTTKLSGFFEAAKLEAGQFGTTSPEIVLDGDGTDGADLGILMLAAVAPDAVPLSTPILSPLSILEQNGAVVRLRNNLSLIATMTNNRDVAQPGSNRAALGGPSLFLFPFFDLSNLVFLGNPQPTQKFSFDATGGFLRFTFTGDFLHKEYAKVLSAVATNEALQKDPTNFPNPPYTPATNGLSLNYEATDLLSPQTGDALFQYGPFGGIEQVALVGESLAPNLSQPNQPTGSTFDTAANLYLGIDQLVPGDVLSLLFEMCPDTEIDLEGDTPIIRWYYLIGNTWVKFPIQHVLLDTTRQLTRSGIIHLFVPNDATSKGNTILNPDLLWIRAFADTTTGGTVHALPAAKSIRAQAFEARFLDQSNELSHLAHPLPAQSISKLAFSDSAIKGIEQPLPSFDGRAPELSGSEAFFRRVSERLRHRDRAVTGWDFERLLLESFPTIATAKCIGHTRYARNIEVLAPGFVTVAVIPDIRFRTSSRRDQPRLPKGDLDEMRDKLLTKSNMFLHEPTSLGSKNYKLAVVNPLYEDLKVEALIKFRAGDENLFILKTKEALDEYIAPWVKDKTVVPSFGRSIYRSHLYVLIENLDFVDYIQAMQVSVWRNDEWEVILDNENLIEPGTARSIFSTSGAHDIRGAQVAATPVSPVVVIMDPVITDAPSRTVNEPVVSPAGVPEKKAAGKKSATKKKNP